jgi:hypothetical protein
MTDRIAACFCGRLTARCRGEPDRISICHCLQCKRRTGSAFAWTASYPADQVETQGERSSFTRSSDEGFSATFHFCPHCGSGVFYEIDRRPGMISVPVGGFADPDFPEPAFSVYAERKPSWIELRTSQPLTEQ